jgi:hypothetical protein
LIESRKNNPAFDEIILFFFRHTKPTSKYGNCDKYKLSISLNIFSLLAILSFSFLLPPDGIFSRLGFENGGRIKPRIEIHLFAMNQKGSIKPSQKKGPGWF